MQCTLPAPMSRLDCSTSRWPSRQVTHTSTPPARTTLTAPAAGVLALNATVITNKRKIEADKFFKGMYETALEQGEIITAISFPIPKRGAYMKFKNPASRYAIVGVFIADFGNAVRVAVTGAAAGVFRVAEMEKALGAKFAPESVANIKVPDADLNSDMHAKADYRAHLITVMAKRAVEKALGSTR